MAKAKKKNKKILWADDILTDNTQIKYCTQCKDCVYWGNNPNDVYSNDYTKAYCDQYPRPVSKPEFVIWNTDKCPYRKEK